MKVLRVFKGSTELTPEEKEEFRKMFSREEQEILEQESARLEEEYEELMQTQPLITNVISEYDRNDWTKGEVDTEIIEQYTD